MTINNDVNVVFKPRGDVKQDLFMHGLEVTNIADASHFLGYEYLLKQLHLIDEKIDLKELLLESEYDHVYGFYQPKTKNLVIMERTTDQIAAAILLHELVHAAQDDTVDLTQYRDKYCTSIDACLASSALLEGQATTVELLIKIEQNLKDKTAREILEAVNERLESADYYGGKKEDDFLSKAKSFPYLMGQRFVISRYLKRITFTSMFEKVPASTAQVLHPDKFEKDQRPMTTKLAGKKSTLSRIPGVKLLLETSFGEFCIQAILENILKGDPKRIRNATAGWGGDTICVLQGDRGLFFVWDTLWDAPAKADEFYQCYLDFSKNRYKPAIIQTDTKSDVLMNNDHGFLLVKKTENRVVIMEGSVSSEVLQSIMNLIR